MKRFSGVLWPIEVPRVTMPFKATWTRWYSEDKPHRGVDIAPWPGSSGRPVRAPIHATVIDTGDHPAAGLEVILRGEVPYAWGAVDLNDQYVAFDAHEPFFIRTTHHRSVKVRPGQIVAAGEIIATIGSTGTNTSGPHVHLEIRKGAYTDGLVVDPLHFFIAAIPGLKATLDMA